LIATQRALINSTFGLAIQPKAKSETGLPRNPQSGVESRSAISTSSSREVSQRKGKFSAVAKSPGGNSVTSLFIQSHMGNKKNAEQTALNRGLPVSHTIDIGQLSKLLGEMHTRQQQGYYVAANQVSNPNGNPNQYLTGKTYKIWETKTDNKGRLKPTKEINKRFYYDAPAGHGNACHHFDGIA
jgi:hypothetical protein